MIVFLRVKRCELCLPIGFYKHSVQKKFPMNQFPRYCPLWYITLCGRCIGEGTAPVYVKTLTCEHTAAPAVCAQYNMMGTVFFFLSTTDGKKGRGSRQFISY